MTAARVVRGDRIEAAEPRDSWLTVRMSRPERASIDRAAKALGVSTSDYVRLLHARAEKAEERRETRRKGKA